MKRPGPLSRPVFFSFLSSYRRSLGTRSAELSSTMNRSSKVLAVEASPLGATTNVQTQTAFELISTFGSSRVKQRAQYTTATAAAATHTLRSVRFAKRARKPNTAEFNRNTGESIAKRISDSFLTGFWAACAVPNNTNSQAANTKACTETSDSHLHKRRPLRLNASGSSSASTRSPQVDDHAL